MSCGLHTKLETAYAAAREAFDTAHSTDALSDNDLNLLFVYYQGIKKLKEALPEHKEEHPVITFDDGILPDGCYDPDYNINFTPESAEGNLTYVVPTADESIGDIKLESPGSLGDDVFTFT